MKNTIVSTLTAAGLSAIVLGAATMAAKAEEKTRNPCAGLAEAQCIAETHCRFQPALLITYQVQGKSYEKTRKARCSLAIKVKRATVTAAR